MTRHHEGGPERRYVQLHRIIESGHANDAIWEELSAVAFRLGHILEAVRCVNRIEDQDSRHRREIWLSERGVGGDRPEAPEPEHRPTEPAKTETPGKPPVRRRRLTGPVLREETFDSIGYLFLDHLPYTVMAVTLMFPLVVGLGGMFTAGTEFWVFPLIALVPVLCIATPVLSLAQQILLESTHGISDPPRLAEFPDVLRRAARFLQAFFASATVLLLPGTLLTRFMGINGLPLLIAGGLLFPTAFALCMTRRDLRGLHPRVLLPTVFRIGLLGLVANVTVWVAFGPALFAFFGSEGSAVFLRLSLVGPLAIAPLFIGARLVGRVLYLSRETIDDLMWTSPDQLDAEQHDPTIQTYSSGRYRRAGHKSGVTKASGVRAAEGANKGSGVRSAAVSEQQRRRRQRSGRLDAPSHPEQRQAAGSGGQARPQPAPARKPAPARQARPQPAPASPLGAAASQPPSELPPIAGDIPVFADFEEMPGFRVLQGDDRINAGAAARRPDTP